MLRVGVVGGGWSRVLGADGGFLVRALGVGRCGVVGRVLGGLTTTRTEHGIKQAEGCYVPP